MIHHLAFSIYTSTKLMKHGDNLPVLDYVIISDAHSTSTIALVRTFSPAHFEDGAWNTGGRCNRTVPLSESEINSSGPEWELRSLQMEEIGKVGIEGGKLGKRFGFWM
ncbi:hypothetical protein F3Y22_tig00117017pilonHSYRG00102 [Hibiscus syriacus]|uniref:Trichome birefringence-like C-terminal domain-containing protein n=1 Tax=Hibiscus syriacus TaxID=106335 RepID=A0A6A2WIE0_HIBSY|nr:hypothetical protein F3Y22_tig00117017pilonHSYRG00102 [Hibiscus syriacus]